MKKSRRKLRSIVNARRGEELRQLATAHCRAQVKTVAELSRAAERLRHGRVLELPSQAGI